MKKQKLFSVLSILLVAFASFLYGAKAQASATDSISQTIEMIEACTVDDSLVNTDSITNTITVNENTRLKKFRETEYDMLCLIAHCEGVKVNAYWDPHGRVWTIGFGNTIRPDGTPVRRGDRIKSEAELMHYFTTHIEGKMFEDMDIYLNIDSMSNAEIVAMGSFLYNCGSGILRKKDGSPSEIAIAANDWFANHSDEAKQALKNLMDQKVRSGGKILLQLQKRRDLEERVMFGELLLDNNGELALENAVNFSECALGGIYCLGKSLPTDTLVLCNRLENISGKNLNDSIQSQLKVVQQPIRYKKPVRRSAKSRR